MTSEIIFYNTPEGNKKVEVTFLAENFWLPQKTIAELFGVEVPAISKHLSNIYETKELDKEATISILETVRKEGNRSVKRNLEYYNLDAIIAVGYRVNSYQATQFRIWATNTLKEYIIKGFLLDDELYASADATKIHMGLTNWKHAPDGKILKSDVSIAKNYLSNAHIKELNRIISAYLDLAENRAERQILMKMVDWEQFLHSFLELSNYPILEDKGKISAVEAKLKAGQEYTEYRKRQDAEYISDFDREIKRIEGQLK